MNLELDVRFRKQCHGTQRAGTTRCEVLSEIDATGVQKMRSSLPHNVGDDSSKTKRLIALDIILIVPAKSPPNESK